MLPWDDDDGAVFALFVVDVVVDAIVIVCERGTCHFLDDGCCEESHNHDLSWTLRRRTTTRKRWVLPMMVQVHNCCCYCCRMNAVNPFHKDDP